MGAEVGGQLDSDTNFFFSSFLNIVKSWFIE